MLKIEKRKEMIKFCIIFFRKTRKDKVRPNYDPRGFFI